MDTVSDVFWLTIVAFLWGGTNPFLKKGGAGIERVKKNNIFAQFFAEIWFLILNWKYMIPFILNQSGSLVFYLTLSSADLSIAVPLTNSLTFIFTFLMGRFLGERTGNFEAYIGMLFVIIGLVMCISSKVMN